MIQIPPDIREIAREWVEDRWRIHYTLMPPSKRESLYLRMSVRRLVAKAIMAERAHCDAWTKFMKGTSA
jgi:hypothetical protein